MEELETQEQEESTNILERVIRLEGEIKVLKVAMEVGVGFKPYYDKQGNLLGYESGGMVMWL